MSCFMVINGICSTNMYARQLSFNFSTMVWGGPWPRGPPLWIRPWYRQKYSECRITTEYSCQFVLNNLTTA